MPSSPILHFSFSYHFHWVTIEWAQVVLEVRAQLLGLLRRKVEQPHLELGDGAKTLMKLVVALLASADDAKEQEAEQQQQNGSKQPRNNNNSHGRNNRGQWSGKKR